MDPGSSEPGKVLDELYCLQDTYGENPAPPNPGKPIYELYVRCD
jgi:hypothetical protein